MQNINDRKKLFSWCGYFFLGNVFLFWLIGLKYIPALFIGELQVFFIPGKIVSVLYVLATYLQHLALLAFLPSMIVFPFIAFFPRRYFIFSLAICMATVVACLLVIDTAVYGLYRFHLSGILMTMVLHGLSEQVFGFSSLEYAITALIIFVIISIECIYAYLLWNGLTKKMASLPKKMAILVGVCFYFSYAGILLNTGKFGARLYLDMTRFVPGYANIVAKIMDPQGSLVSLEKLDNTQFLHPRQSSGQLNYPSVTQLHCSPPKRPMNLVVILIDTWRFNLLNQQYMPNLSQFAKQSWVFTQHSSGGNATGPGVFSLFYGLPSNYRTAMQEQHRGPIMIDELLDQQYQLGVFASANLKWPFLDKTVFQSVRDIQFETPGKTAYERDITITNEFKQFIANKTNHSAPFFGFLFYDASHSYCNVDEALSPFKPAIQKCDRYHLPKHFDPLPYLNRYRNAVLLVDKQIGQVMSALKQKHLLDNTVVVVTGDHGEEFDDLHQGYLGHASNFTHFQVQTPLIVYWPGESPKVFTHRTSHYDIVPTLMSRLLGCQADFSRYSLGMSLLNKKERPYFIVGSYIDYAIIEPKRITTIYPLGNFEISETDGKIIPDGQLNMTTIKASFQDVRRFYRT